LEYLDAQILNRGGPTWAAVYRLPGGTSPPQHSILRASDISDVRACWVKCNSSGEAVVQTAGFDRSTAAAVFIITGEAHFDHDLRLSSIALGQVTVESTGYDATIDGVAAPVSFDNIARVKVITGSGTDTVLAEGLLLSDKLIVNTGLGDDAVQVLGSQLEKLRIDSGGGDDTVLIDSTTVNRQTKVLTRWGEDVVTVRDAHFGRKVTIESGLDDDTLHLLGVNLFSKGLEEDFEQVLEP
jgi:hypothetical protein